MHLISSAMNSQGRVVLVSWSCLGRDFDDWTSNVTHITIMDTAGAPVPVVWWFIVHKWGIRSGLDRTASILGCTMDLNPYSNIGLFRTRYHFHPGPNQIPYVLSSSLPPALNQVYSVYAHTHLTQQSSKAGNVLFSLFYRRKEKKGGREREGMWEGGRVRLRDEEKRIQSTFQVLKLISCSVQIST